MRLLARKLLVRLGIGAIIALSIQGGLTPRPARAGCDHPFGIEIKNSWSAAHLDPLIAGGSRALPEGDRPGVPGRPLPCSGPSCSGRVPLPASAAPTIDRVLDQWVFLPSLFHFSPPVAKACCDDDTTFHLPAEPGRIFHPPRSMA